MIRPSRLSRFATAAVLGSALVVPPPVLAQSAPPPPADAAAPADPAAPAPDTQAADPPARAGRIARLSGTVSFHGPGADQWEAATLNFPLTDGDALWAEPQAEAAIDVAGSRVTLAGGTELDIDKLDAQTLTMTAPQGELYLRLAHLAPGETYAVVTPRGTVTIAAPGRYEIAVGDQASPTAVTVLEGQAQVTGASLDLTVQAGQTGSVTGDQTFTGSVGQLQTDAFLTAMEQQQAPPPAPVAAVAEAVPPPAAVAAMPGAEDLNQYGAWQASPDYGSVWYPRVDADWVPYRHGRWAYVAPWGWTWVDEAPWGFAPFHYGRWVEVEGRWGWAPVYRAPGWVEPGAYITAPIYAPALVSFIGIGIGVGVGFGFGIGASVGWCPLGWGEPFHPWYGGSPLYVQNINRSYVRNVTNITYNTTTINNFANRRAATVVPAGTLTGSRPVAAAVRPLSPQQLAGLRTTPTVPVRPTAATAGVTPVVARRLGLPAAPAGTAARPASPGPAIAPGGGVHPRAPATAAHLGGAAPAAAAVHPAVPGTVATPNAAHPGAPGPAIVPHTAGAAGAPSLRPVVPSTAPRLPAATGGQAPAVHPGAPGPAITPHAAGVAPAPGLRPVAPAASGVPAHPAVAPALHAPTAGGGLAHPAPAPLVHAAPTAPVAHAPAPAAPGQQATPPAVRPAPVTPHVAAPAPRVATPAPQQHVAAPAPRVAAPAPQQHFAAPAPRVPAPAPQPHFAAPAPHVAAPAPQPHFAAPAPHSAPAPQHSGGQCPPGQKSC